MYGFARKELRSIESPAKRYSVKITEKRFLIEHAVYLNANRASEPLVKGKLLYTGDFMDNEFGDLYPNYSWRSESVLKIGRSIKPDLDNLRVVNETPNRIAYLLIETYDDKFILFDLEPGIIVNLSFAYFGQLSCQGEFADSKERLGAAVKLLDGEKSKAQSQFNVRISGNHVVIENQASDLIPINCCAADRPDFQHEWLY
jgi:hypothetical protein